MGTVTIDSGEYLALVNAAREPSRTVTIPLEEYRRLIGAPLAETSMTGDLLINTELNAHVNVFIASAIGVMQYAVANLPPEVNVNWPSADLGFAADALEHLRVFPALKVILEPELLAKDWREFAAQAAALDEQRVRDKRPATFARPEDFGPRSAEARQMHAFKQQASAGETFSGDGAPVQAEIKENVAPTE